ncbi:hypothetical protein GCM10022244_58230 [Streptomyces gulbargensis]|uniref:Uncharacterized protein n=1 Tax=Streptomyces gulbargensis TaxID=364901 RepID=A0ABP7NC74_9ACTN
MSRPVCIEAAKKEALSATPTTPAVTGDMPRPSWRKRDSTNVSPADPPNSRATQTTPRVKPGSRKTTGSSSGLRPAAIRRRWCAANPASSGRDRPRLTHVQAGHPDSRPTTSGSTSATSPVADSTAPNGSSPRAPAPEPAPSAGSSRTIASASTPSGTLMRKQARHPSPPRSAASSSPPTACPPVPATPTVAPYQAKARARSAPGNMRPISART